MPPPCRNHRWQEIEKDRRQNQRRNYSFSTTHFSASFNTSSIISRSRVRSGFPFASAILRATASISSFTRITTTVPTLRMALFLYDALKQSLGRYQMMRKCGFISADIDSFGVEVVERNKQCPFAFEPFLSPCECTQF